MRLGPIPPENMWNYDETNMQDDPGKDWVIVRRGRKRVENAKDYSKTTISAMWCGNAAGEMLPPMIVYKAIHCYAGWTIGGPLGSHYTSTDSGWFDSRTFEEWFIKIFLPNVQGRPGAHFLLGDNLSSHFNGVVIGHAVRNSFRFRIDYVEYLDYTSDMRFRKLSLQNYTENPHFETKIRERKTLLQLRIIIFHRFLMFLPNATHYLQTLDVAVFGPMKRQYRSVLDDYKKESRTIGAFNKRVFPMLLARLWNMMESNVQVKVKSDINTFLPTTMRFLNEKTEEKKTHAF